MDLFGELDEFASRRVESSRVDGGHWMKGLIIVTVYKPSGYWSVDSIEIYDAQNNERRKPAYILQREKSKFPIVCLALYIEKNFCLSLSLSLSLSLCLCVWKHICSSPDSCGTKGMLFQLFFAALPLAKRRRG